MSLTLLSSCCPIESLDPMSCVLSIELLREITTRIKTTRKILGRRREKSPEGDFDFLSSLIFFFDPIQCTFLCFLSLPRRSFPFEINIVAGSGHSGGRRVKAKRERESRKRGKRWTGRKNKKREEEGMNEWHENGSCWFWREKLAKQITSLSLSSPRSVHSMVSFRFLSWCSKTGIFLLNFDDNEQKREGAAFKRLVSTLIPLSILKFLCRYNLDTVLCIQTRITLRESRNLWLHQRIGSRLRS